MGIIPIVIPAYEPDDKLIGLVENLNSENMGPLVVVNDGSDRAQYGYIFNRVKELGAAVLDHAVNMGKGRGLKTAFNYCLNEWPDLVGVVTADSDGQHSIEDIKKCIQALIDNPDRFSESVSDSDKSVDESDSESTESEIQYGALVLGCRDFNQSDVPLKSSFGNKTTSRVMKILVGLSISDTQTGLRGITREFMKFLLTEKGERFEFETNMLLATKDLGISIVEVPIRTIYLEGNTGTHFNPIRDSAMIYAVFFKFIFSSLSSSVVDALMFMLACNMTRNVPMAVSYIIVSTVIARVVSATYNFLVNYKVVFKGKGSKRKAAVRYIALALIIMFLSATLVDMFHGFIPGVLEIFVKIPVDVLLFFMSFFVQRELVYKD
ncbi:GtrA family protein [Butyrivibrio proteoclasticus]|uniref:GtrA family protein n=1 Tax=Butyrivibrio proteoclasticus TaxID=43305 RepID=UPI00047C2C61|nr:GtrA family protein [Butyrivibrio proteoclasticus]